MEINTKRMDDKIEETRNKLFNLLGNKHTLVKSAEQYLNLLLPILKKRGIKIKSNQMYFNNILDQKSDRAMFILNFEKKYGDYMSTKVKNLEKEIREANIPCPCSNFNNSVSITLYPGVLYNERGL